MCQMVVLLMCGGVSGGDSTICLARFGGVMHHSLVAGYLVQRRMVVRCSCMRINFAYNSATHP